MPSTHRRRDPGVVNCLLTSPHRFEFFQALRVIESWHARAPSGKRGDEFDVAVRLHNSLSLSFPASEIEALCANASAAPEPGEPPRIEITPAFFGLLGSSGALPAVYTERIARSEFYTRDRAARAFLDIFAHRAGLLLYRAWKKYRLELEYEFGRGQSFAPYVFSLAGFGHRVLRERVEDGARGLPAEVIGYYAAMVRHRPVSAVMLRTVLADYFRVSVRIEQFVGRWYPMPAEQRSLLGAPSARLGASACAGERVWQRHLRLRLIIGPLDHATFTAMLPGGKAADALGRFVTLLLGHALEVEVQPILRREDVRPTRLGTAAGQARLGWDSWAMTRDPSRDAADVRFEVSTMHRD